MKMTQAYAGAVAAKANCEASGNDVWAGFWAQRIKQLDDTLPHGSGFDGVVALDEEKSGSHMLVFIVDWHCMDDAGCYDGWRRYEVRVKPTFAGPRVLVFGKDYNGVKEYIADVFHSALTSEVPGLLNPDLGGQR